MIYVECPDTTHERNLSLFLAGGISGCRDWQSEIVSKLYPLDIILYNPRRKNFDISNKNITVEQITWEEEKLRQADIIAFYFCRETSCPITLYELGVANATRYKPVIIGMDPDYSRREDVEIQTRLKKPDTLITYNLDDFGASIESLIKSWIPHRCK